MSRLGATRPSADRRHTRRTSLLFGRWKQSGVFQAGLGRWKVASTVPLSLFRAWANLELQQECLVYPRPGPRRPVPQTAVYKPNQAGDKGRGVDDFACLRPYRPGDSPRHLFWKAVAREQPLLVKQFGGDRVDELWLDWNDLDDLETEARLPGLQLDMAGDSAHRQRCLQALARYQHTPDDTR